MYKYLSMATLLVLGQLPSTIEAAIPIKWTINYSEEIPISDLHPYDLIILDDQVGTIASPLKKQGKEVLSYLSLGEISDTRPYFREAKRQNLFLHENPNWPGSYAVDLRNPAWKKMLIHKIIPKILESQFTGLFLDTLDTPLYLEVIEPEKYKGMKEAAINLIKSIRKHFPHIKLMLNRAYEILPEAAPYIDSELAESLYTTYDFAEKKYQMVSEEEYNETLALLEEVKKNNPQLKIFVLNYWDPEDVQTIRKIYEMDRKNGFHPYVSTVDLLQIIPEPQ